MVTERSSGEVWGGMRREWRNFDETKRVMGTEKLRDENYYYYCHEKNKFVCDSAENKTMSEREGGKEKRGKERNIKKDGVGDTRTWIKETHIKRNERIKWGKLLEYDKDNKGERRRKDEKMVCVVRKRAI